MMMNNIELVGEEKNGHLDKKHVEKHHTFLIENWNGYEEENDMKKVQWKSFVRMIFDLKML
jgi:hypothetical protein